MIAVLSASVLLSVTSCTSENVGITQDSFNTDPSDSTQSQTDIQTQAGVQTDAQTEPVDTDDGRISFIAAGDNLAHEAVYTFASTLAERNESYDGEYYFEPMYDDIRFTVQKADLAMINQESQICTSPFEASGYPRFATPVNMGQAIMNAGFNIIVMANNHMLDNGDDGIENTVDYWKDKPVMAIGAYTSENDADQIAIFEEDGFKIAVLAYTDVINHCDDYDDAVKSSKYAKYSYYNEETAHRQIKKANELADFVIVSMHWGDEDEFEPDASQKQIAHDLAAWGANVIIGHHPHVVQTIEWIETDNGKALCVYSLGNFLSTMLYARNMVGMMVSFDIVKNGTQPYVDNVRVIPTVTNYTDHPTKDDLKYRQNVHVYLMENYTEKMATDHGCNSNESKAVTLDRLRSYITDNVPAEFLPGYLQ